MTNNIWPDGRLAAVSLSYDDALPIHYELVAPLLEDAGIRGTFYTHISPKFMERVENWRAVAGRGHELGNHSLFHPCRMLPEYTFLKPYYDLRRYTLTQFGNELRIANFTLSLIDGRKERSYGNNCCNTTVGDGDRETSMDPVIDELFAAGRGPKNDEVFLPGERTGLAQVGHFEGDFKSYDQMRREVESACEQGGWILYMMHGVGDRDHNLFIDPDEHAKVVRWLGEEGDRIWTAPVVDVARRVRASWTDQ